MQATLPVATRLVVASPGKRRRGPESGPTTGSAIAAGKAIAFVADPKVDLRLAKAVAADISSASGGMLDDARREPSCFGGHKYKLFSDVVDETGEDREARIDRGDLALNAGCLTLGMVRELANASPGPTDGDSGEEEVAPELDPIVEECDDERIPSANPPGVNGSEPLAYKLRTRACARAVGEQKNVRPIKIARARRVRRALAKSNPRPELETTVELETIVEKCEDKRLPLSNSPGVQVGAKVGALAAHGKPQIRPIELARAARARRAQKGTFGLVNPPGPPTKVRVTTPSAGMNTEPNAFVSPGLGTRFKTVDAALYAPQFKTYAESSDSARRLMERDAVIANVFRKNKKKV